MMIEHKFRVGFLFSGSGFGARGLEEARAQIGQHVARFENIGGVDFDALACKDFEYLSAGPATVADLHEMQPSGLRRAWGERAPDCIFSSPPCKAFSQLLSKKKAESEEYQRMAGLFIRGLMLSIETWADDPPGLLIFENVPAITTRGAHLLEQARATCRHYGYKIDERVFDCGEIGGLAQRRRRYAFTARLPRKVREEVHTPPLQRVKACGEVLWPLPLPNDPAGGPMHRIPDVSLLTWLRLAFIPAGGDWRDLAPSAAAYSDGRLRSPLEPGQRRSEHFPKYDVRRGDQPAHTVAGSGTNGGYGVADPRVAQLDLRPRPRGSYGVETDDAPASTVRGRSDLQNATSSIADPRLSGVPLRGEHYRGTMGVAGADEPADTVRGRADVRTGPAAVADERLAQLPLPCGGGGTHTNLYAVAGSDESTRTVTGAVKPSSGAACVSDPRLAVEGERFNHSLRVAGTEEPAGTVTAGGSPNNGAVSVADPRLAALPLGQSGDGAGTFKGRPGLLGVNDDREAIPTVSGNASVSGSNMPAAVSDPRVAGAWREDRPGLMGVTDGSAPAPTVSGKAGVTQGNMPAAVADPRLEPLGLTHQREQRFSDQYRVQAGTEPAACVTGTTDVQAGAPVVADPRLERLPLGCEGRNGFYGVTGADQPADTVTGSLSIDCGRAAVAAPVPRPPVPACYRFLSVEEALDMLARREKLKKGEVAVIASPHDGYWHRPLTDYELAILQSAPSHIDGKPLQLHGTSRAKVREHIGNAVPKDSAKAWGAAFLSALLRSALGVYAMCATQFWVRRDETPADELEVGDAA